MLGNLLDSWFKIDVGEGAFYAAFGFLFVFLGIAVLILIFTVFGFAMKKVNERRAKRETAEVPKPRREEVMPPAEAEEGISPELAAVIAAAVAATLSESAGKCDFVVRRIKRL